jgi:thioredoxin 1
MNMSAIALTKDNFNKEAIETKDTVLIDFWATWCGPCRMLSPVVDEIANENHVGVKVCKVNVDEQPDLASQFNVRSIPTLVVLKDGKPVAGNVGVTSKHAILSMLEKAN